MRQIAVFALQAIIALVVDRLLVALVVQAITVPLEPPLPHNILVQLDTTLMLLIYTPRHSAANVLKGTIA